MVVVLVFLAQSKVVVLPRVRLILSRPFLCFLILFDRIIQMGHYSERKVGECTRIIVGVLETCRLLEVMHRDLKLKNFLLVDKDDDFSLKAIDFGFSVFFKLEVGGRPYYVALEVSMNHYGPKTIGVILYILVSGVTPFWAGMQYLCWSYGIPLSLRRRY
ncbi:hypothetical protein Cgig2_020983 [Carnegiea gigantea]|uniref:Protein kinase domain-containing protein n=1 Tax=Carnegiea gigantea TaxID=171969 RepID=A0A9Q1Q5T9_9CARY|nr:hypothetical protein Cgig2_020983 [Carnegiea gigantea]